MPTVRSPMAPLRVRMHVGMSAGTTRFPRTSCVERGRSKLSSVMCVVAGRQVEPLVERYGDEFELCIFDNRGCGRSSCPDSKFRYMPSVRACVRAHSQSTGTFHTI